MSTETDPKVPPKPMSILNKISETITEMLETVSPGLGKYTFVVEIIIIAAVVLIIVF